MKVRSTQLIQTIAYTLEHQVLPELAAATWTASYVRSCLMLLAQLEARVGIEDEILAEDNAELTALLEKAGVAPTSMPPAEGRDRLARLQDKNELLQQSLGDVIERAFSGDAELLTRIREDLRQYRLHSLERDARVLGRAISMSPL
jgi:hypothetical protein